MELEIVRNLIDRLNSEKILYCHWKSNQHVVNAFNGIDDIDMIVNNDDVLKLNIILNELGYKRFRLPEKRSYIGIEDYLGFDNKRGTFVHLHLHYQLTLGEKFLKGYQLPYGKEIINRRIYDTENKIYITSHEDEMWLLLIRLALKLRCRDRIKLALGKDIFGTFTRAEYEWLKKNMDKNIFSKVTEEKFGEEISIILKNIIEGELEFKKIHNLKKYIKKKFKIFKAFTDVGATITRWDREIFRIRQEIHKRIYKDIKSYRRTPITGGKFIAILGPDGAGKSTVINEVYKRLNKMMDVHNVYLGSGDGESSLIRKPLKYIYKIMIDYGVLNRKSKRIDSDGNVYREEEKKAASKIRSIGQIPWTYTLSREKKNKIQKAQMFRNKGYVVISDRYPQTQFINICDGPKYYLNNKLEKNFVNNILEKCEKKCFDLATSTCLNAVIILKVDSEVAYERKPDEIDVNTHRLLMNSILNLEFGENTNKIIVDANQPLEDVINSVLLEIWRNL